MPRKDKTGFLIQYIVAIVASITSAGYGSVMSWTSPSLPFLKSGKSNLSVNNDEIAWIAPLLPIGIIIGNFLNPIFIDRLGRKWTLLLFAIPQIISWLLILLAKNTKIICIGRIFGGIGYGGGICATIVYLSEIGNCKNRGIFLTLIKVSSSFGIFFTIFLGAISPYFYMNLCLLIMPIVFVIFFPFMPDSSYFFAKNCKNEEKKFYSLVPLNEKENKNDNDCEKKIIVKENENYKLNFKNENKINDNEGDDKKNHIEEKKNFKLENYQNSENKNKILNKKNNFPNDYQLNNEILKNKENGFLNLKNCNFWQLLSIRSNLRGLFIIFTVTTLDCFSGHPVLVYFSQQMLTYEGSLLSPKNGALIHATVKLLASMIATQIIERFQRKTILLCTSILITLTQGILTIFFFIKDNNLMDISLLGFLPYLAFLIYETASSIGASNLFYIYQGEFFENHVKGMAVTVSKIYHMFMIFLTIVIYQCLIVKFSSYVIFGLFCICCVIFSIVCLIIIPETKGKSLEEIQIILKRRKVFL
ncbi:glucose transporter GlcP-like [Leptopilina boulardi]|uniref:glucose transporter GlcP-like n=1 Tax=Leptopilina boulardi TaxID=63433 RepID=UPI0021F50C96|nr:glucose transporter GlcP-like [Leptopilina boulardi]